MIVLTFYKHAILCNLVHEYQSTLILTNVLHAPCHLTHQSLLANGEGTSQHPYFLASVYNKQKSKRFKFQLVQVNIRTSWHLYLISRNQKDLYLDYASKFALYPSHLKLSY